LTYLLDTSVVSEICKSSPDTNLIAWIDPIPSYELYISVLVVGEIRQGIDRLSRRDHDQADVLERWLAQLRADFSDRVLPITAEIADEWGRLNVPEPIPAIDGLMAATAIVAGFILATRNTRDLQSTGARLLNSFLPLC